MSQLLALLLLQAGCAVVLSVSAREMEALHELYDSTKGEHWRNISVPWNFSVDASGDYLHDPCVEGWTGLRCHSPPYLCSLGNCSVTDLFMQAFNMSGTIPESISDLSYLHTFFAELNRLTGTIPSSIGLMTRMDAISLERNLLSGTLPHSIGNLLGLSALDLESNQLTGSVPIEFSKLSSLRMFDLEDNKMTGPISREFCEMTSLGWVNLQNNFFTGVIPEAISRLSNLRTFNVRFNMLSGSLPHNVWMLAKLFRLDLKDNCHTGTISSGIGELTSLGYLDLSGNTLSGSLPHTIGGLAAVEDIDLHSNSLTGSLPESMGNLLNLNSLALNDNFLSGSITAKFGIMTSMRSLFLQNNALSGRIEEVFNTSVNTALDVVELSNNLLTGRVNGDLFGLPAVRVISLSVNCFQEALSASICRGPNIEVLSLNGLGAADACGNIVTFPISEVKLFNTIGGTIPECLWSMRNLSVLHLTGNGLEGRSSSDIPSGSLLTDISLSHNQLSGSIPQFIERVQSVDLSYNQFSGRYSRRDPFSPPNSYVNMVVNRLSGQLPVSSLGNVSTLKLLKGNLFSCDTIPSNDVDVKDYICGSEDLNESLFVLSSILSSLCWAVLACGLVALLHRYNIANGCSCLQHVYLIVSQLFAWLYYFDRCHLKNCNIRRIKSISDRLYRTAYFFLRLAVLELLVVVPIYVLRGRESDDDVHYSTHTTTYAWFWTLAYMRGVVVSILIGFAWMISFSFCFYHTTLVPFSEGEIGGEGTKTFKSEAKELTPYLSSPELVAVADASLLHSVERNLSTKVLIFVSLTVNAIITIVVNALYIYSTQQPLSALVHFGIQLSLAFFRLIYSFVIFPILARPIVDPVANIGFRLGLMIFDNLAIPLIATSLTSDSCFSGLIVAADSVSTSYAYEECLAYFMDRNLSIACLLWRSVSVESAAVIPPFTYNNQCFSVLLTAYIPVLTLAFSIQLTLCFLIPLVLCRLKSFSMIECFVKRKVVKGVLWPKFWMSNEDESFVSRIMGWLKEDLNVLWSPKSVLCFDILNNILIMLTFGLCSPILAFTVSCAVLSKMIFWVFLIGRFTNVISSTTIGDDNVHFVLSAFAHIQFPLREVLQRSIWTIGMCSASFFSLFCWDIASDDVGWVSSMWIPFLILCFPCMLWICCRYRVCFRKQDVEIRRETELGKVLSHKPADTMNPLQVI